MLFYQLTIYDHTLKKRHGRYVKKKSVIKTEIQSSDNRERRRYFCLQQF